MLAYPSLAPLGDADVPQLRVDQDPGLLVVLQLQPEVVGHGLLVVAEGALTRALVWQPVRPAVTMTGVPGKADLEACWELGALLAAEVAG